MVQRGKYRHPSTEFEKVNLGTQLHGFTFLFCHLLPMVPNALCLIYTRRDEANSIHPRVEMMRK